VIEFGGLGLCFNNNKKTKRCGKENPSYVMKMLLLLLLLLKFKIKKRGTGTVMELAYINDSK